MNRGKLKQNGVHLEEHEYKTVKLLLSLGYNIELQPPNQTKNTRSADLWMNGVLWEMKAPEGGGKNTVRHNLERAKKQSQNVIIDLHRCKLSDEQAIKELKHHFKLSKRFKRMKIITKSREILDLY